METRGYYIDVTRDHKMFGLPVGFYKPWTATPAARKLVLERIALRISEKPHLYKESTP